MYKQNDNGCRINEMNGKIKAKSLFKVKPQLCLGTRINDKNEVFKSKLRFKLEKKRHFPRYRILVKDMYISPKIINYFFTPEKRKFVTCSNGSDTYLWIGSLFHSLHYLVVLLCSFHPNLLHKMKISLEKWILNVVIVKFLIQKNCLLLTQLLNNYRIISLYQILWGICASILI